MPLIEAIINAAANIGTSFTQLEAFGVSMDSLITIGVVVLVGGYLLKRMGITVSKK